MLARAAAPALTIIELMVEILLHVILVVQAHAITRTMTQIIAVAAALNAAAVFLVPMVSALLP